MFRPDAVYEPTARSGVDGRAAEEVTMAEATEPKPGDDAPPGTPGTGENVCSACGGSGKIGAAACETCAGTGIVTEAIGGA
jgi:hypothetical protein